MNALLGKFALLVLAVGCLLGLFVWCPWLPNEPFLNLARKHAALEGMAGKKVILIGGSGVANGLSARVIADQLPGYHAVNMGLNAGLGLDFNINEVAEQIKPGDIAVLCPEYDNFETGGRGGVQLLKAINAVPAEARYLDRGRLEELVRHDALTFLQVKAQSYFNGLIGLVNKGSAGYDELGDKVSKDLLRDIGRMPFSFAPTRQSYAECLQALNTFDRFCRMRGAVAVLSFPSLAPPQYRVARSEIERLYRDLLRDSSILILHEPGANVLDTAYFTDTYYHLNPAGRSLRSRHTAQWIKAALDRGALSFGAPVESRLATGILITSHHKGAGASGTP